MAFALDHFWVWDFWLAEHEDLYHLFYLHAPKSLGDPELRHRNARIGHATSRDLMKWQDHGEILRPGADGAFDETATWTGCVVEGHDGIWRLFYTGSRFLGTDTNANIESVGVALSDDLYSWTKQPGPILTADPRWYETLGTSSWPEEAWRDPWVFADPDGTHWHMLITARTNHGDDAGRGVIGHAVSNDLEHWEARPPLSDPQQGFGHLEVPQLVEIDGHRLLVFSCNAPRLSQQRAGQIGGVWVAPADGPLDPFAIDRSTLLATEELYAGRLVQRRDGTWALMAFEMGSPGKPFEGRLCDPIPVRWDDELATLVAAKSSR